MLSPAFAPAIATLLLWAVASVAARKLSELIGNAETAALIVASGVLPLVVGLFLFPVAAVSAWVWILSMASGLFLAFGYTFFYRTLETQYASTSSALLSIQPALLFLFGIFVLGESLNTVEIAGVIVVFVGMFLVTTIKHMRGLNRRMLPAVVGNIFWTIYWILLTFAFNASGQIILPLTIARAVALVVIGIDLLNRNVWKKPKIAKRRYRKLLTIGAISGVLNGLGNVTFALLILLNVLAIGSVITAIGPAVILGLAALFLKERPTKLQLFGIALSVIGAVAIAVF